MHIGKRITIRILRALAFVVCAVAPGSVLSQSQVQFTYDPAGNLVSVTRPTKSDLAVSNLTLGAITQHPGGGYDIAATFTVTNVGSSAATASWYDRGYLSSTGTLLDTDQQLAGNNYRTTNLLPSAAYVVNVTFVTSAGTSAGPTYLIVKADGGTAASGQFSPTGANVVDEASEANNVQAVALTLPAQVRDLTVTTASVGSLTVNQNGSYAIPITYTVANIGGVSAPASWYDLAYLSTDAALDNADVNLGGWSNHGTALAAGASYTATTTYTATTSTAPGSYTLFFKADGHGTVVGGTNTDNGALSEGNEGNNTFAMPLTLPAKPDLQISNASAGTVVVNQNGSYSIPITYTVTNAGGSIAQSSWYDLAYLSADAALNNADTNLGGWSSRGTPLAAGSSYTATTTYTASASVAPGSYTLFMKTDGHGAVVGGTNTDSGAVIEGNDANNAYAMALTLPARADLQVPSASVGTITKNANGSYSIPITYTVTNAGGSTALPSWYDLAYLSTDGTLDNADANLSGWSSRGTALAVGASYTSTKTYTTSTTTAAGNYTLFFKTDAHGAVVGGTNTDSGGLAEGSEANNTFAISITLSP